MPHKSVSFGGVISYPSNINNNNLTSNNNNNNNKQMILKDEKSLKSRFNCGVLRSSLKINGPLISIRLVSSKLRKREDGSVVTNNNNINNNSTTTTTTVIQEAEVRPTPPPLAAVPLEPPPFLWRYSNSSQFSLQHNDHTTLVTNVTCEEISECKGFRQNLRGKWRRLVKKKPQPEVYTIPAEFRDQLKQIYVY